MGPHNSPKSPSFRLSKRSSSDESVANNPKSQPPIPNSNSALPKFHPKKAPGRFGKNVRRALRSQRTWSGIGGVATGSGIALLALSMTTPIGWSLMSVGIAVAAFTLGQAHSQDRDKGTQTELLKTLGFFLGGTALGATAVGGGLVASGAVILESASTLISNFTIAVKALSSSEAITRGVIGGVATIGAVISGKLSYKHDDLKQQRYKALVNGLKTAIKEDQIIQDYFTKISQKNNNEDSSDSSPSFSFENLVDEVQEKSIQKKLSKEERALWKALHQFLLELGSATHRDAVDHRTNCHQLIRFLRRAYDQKAYKNAQNTTENETSLFLAVNLLNRLGTLHIAHVNIHETNKTIVKKVIGEPSKTGQENTDNFSQMDLPQDHEALRLAVTTDRIRNQIGIDSDPHAGSNQPYTSSTVTIAERTITNVRMGTPTIQGITGTKIIPNFLGMLRDYKKRSTPEKPIVHLYFNFQKLKSGRFDAEQSRSAKIHSLEQKFPNHFYAVSLDQDSDFYKQKGEHDKEEQATTFIKNFHERLFDEKSSKNYRIPDAWKDNEDFKNQAKALMNTLHEHLFEKKEKLSKEEKENFIEIYYSLFMILCIQKSNCESFNCTCKDAIDRGAKSNALLTHMFHLFAEKEPDPNPTYNDDLATLLHAPALMVKKQAMIPSRRSRAINAFKKLGFPIEHLISKENSSADSQNLSTFIPNCKKTLNLSDSKIDVSFSKPGECS